MRLLRSLLVIALAAAVATACGASPAPSSEAPSGRRASFATPNLASIANLPSGSVTPTGSAGRTQLPCADLNNAWDSVRQTLDLIVGMQSDDAWAAALAPGSPVKLDPDAFAASIDRLAGLAGQSDTIKVLRSVVPLYRAAVKSGHPFAETSGLGQKLVVAADDANVLAKVEIPTALDILGCTGV
jgi:hypothetical protein